jgi:hypothetical protein
MINTQQLQKIFNPLKYFITNEIEYYTQVHKNTHKKLMIYIINDKNYNFLINHYNNCIRKNCLIIKRRFHNEIYIQEDYIKYILRQRLLNYLLND